MENSIKVGNEVKVMEPFKCTEHFIVMKIENDTAVILPKDLSFGSISDIPLLLLQKVKPFDGSRSASWKSGL